MARPSSREPGPFGWLARGAGLLAAVLCAAMLQSEVVLFRAQSPAHGLTESLFPVVALASLISAWRRPRLGAALLLGTGAGWFIYLPLGAAAWGIESGVFTLGRWTFGAGVPLAACLFWLAGPGRGARRTLLDWWPVLASGALALAALRLGLGP